MENEKLRILLVDDEQDILDFLSYNLEKKGFQVWTAENGLKAVDIAERVIPHVIVMDLMMPELDGYEACIQIRAKEQLTKCFICFLTARNEEFTEIAVLNAGADNYIQKPVSIGKLTGYIQALGRRHPDFISDGTTNEEKMVSFDKITVDISRYEVTADNKKVDLSRKEFDILKLLLNRPGKVFYRRDIYRKVWGEDVIVSDRTIDVHISKLRAKIGKQYIQTIKGVGYKIDYPIAS